MSDLIDTNGFTSISSSEIDRSVSRDEALEALNLVDTFVDPDNEHDEKLLEELFGIVRGFIQQADVPPFPGKLSYMDCVQCGGYCAIWSEQDQQPANPEGYALVPIQPTIDMTEAGMERVMKGMDWERAQSAYKAMIKAAPKPEDVGGK